MGPGRPAFIDVTVAGAPQVALCIDLELDDPLGARLMKWHALDDPLHRLLLGLVRPGMRVLDAGCRLGTFSIPAASLGAEVVAVDASPSRADLVRRSAERNRLDAVHVVHGAVTDESIAEVPAVLLGDVLAERGWERVDLVKLDLEGAEPVALGQLAELFERGDRPVIGTPGNARALARAGSSIVRLRAMLADLGYRIFLVEDSRLIEAPPDSVYTQPVPQYVALPEPAPELAPEWRVEPPLGLGETAMRIAERVAGPDKEDRRHFAELLADGPAWLRGNPLVAPGYRALAIDVDPATRRIFEPDRVPSGAAELATTPEPLPRPLPDGVAVLAAGISLRRPSFEPERREPVAAESLLVHDLSFHVRRGEHLGVLGGHSATAPLLLRVAAGLDRPFVGQVDLYGTPLLVSTLGKLLEPGLTMWDNIALLAGYAGFDVRNARARAEGIARHAGVARELSMPLLEVGTTAVLRMVVAVLLECTSSEVVLFLDELPRLDDHQFVQWAAERAAERRREGLTIVQACGERDWPLGMPTRILWLPEDEDAVCGYPESILDWLRRQSLQLESPPPRVPAGVSAR